MDFLDEAAIELHVNLDMFSYDYGGSPLYPTDAYGEFCAYATLCGLEPYSCEFSSLAHLSDRQLYLACAWAYLRIARQVSLDPSRDDEERGRISREMLQAALNLVDDVLVRAHSLIACGANENQTAKPVLYN